MAVNVKLTLALATLTVLHVMSGTALGEDAEVTRVRLTSIERTLQYVMGAVRHVGDNLERLNQRHKNYPNYEALIEKLEALKNESGQVSEKIQVAINSVGEPEAVRDTKALKVSLPRRSGDIYLTQLICEQVQF